MSRQTIVYAFVLVLVYATVQQLGKGKIRLLWVIVAFAMPLCSFALFLTQSGTLIRSTNPGFDTTYCLIYGFFTACLMAGFCEEIIFRGLMMGAIDQRWGRIPAVIIPSVLFAAAQNNKAHFVMRSELFP